MLARDQKKLLAAFVGARSDHKRVLAGIEGDDAAVKASRTSVERRRCIEEVMSRGVAHGEDHGRQRVVHLVKPPCAIALDHARARRIGAYLELAASSPESARFPRVLARNVRVETRRAVWRFSVRCSGCETVDGHQGERSGNHQRTATDGTHARSLALLALVPTPRSTAFT